MLQWKPYLPAVEGARKKAVDLAGTTTLNFPALLDVTVCVTASRLTTRTLTPWRTRNGVLNVNMLIVMVGVLWGAA
jgi:hypothetical protein